jgi:Fe-S-cluster-containing hydrogenase component 2
MARSSMESRMPPCTAIYKPHNWARCTTRRHNTATQRYAQTKNHAARGPPCGGDGGLLEIEELANYLAQSTLDTSSKSITYDPSLCIGCSRCVRACDQLQGMKVLEAGASHPAAGMAAPTAPLPTCMTTRAGRPLAKTDCISCGQCTVFCPTGAIKEVDHTARVMRALLDPHVVVGGRPPNSSQRAGDNCRNVWRSTGGLFGRSTCWGSQGGGLSLCL